MNGRTWTHACESRRHGSEGDALTITVDRFDIENGRATLTMVEAASAYDEDGDLCDSEAHITLTPESLERLAASALEAASELRRMAADMPAECEVERARR